ncbi:MAG: aminotransferase class III-fold pyridoxal phosphate-dependent enzyme, partial [Bacteroidia bacterium]|nr:aminotransferase class III-fold pyridoxal phosphate-dependent enzyme [Bacteroidia bacterium]
TWGGNLTDMVRAAKILEIIEEDNLVEHVATIGEYFLDSLVNLAEKFPIVSNVRGRGFFCAFDLPSTDIRNEFIKRGLEKNVMFLACGPKSIRFRPSLIMTRTEIDEGVNVMQDVLKSLS